MAMACIELDEVLGHFDQLEDPRSTINQKHPLVSVVIIAMMAVLAGASGPTTIAMWAESRKSMLTRVLDLPHGVPRKDVFRRVLSLLNPGAFQACFTSWLTALRTAAADAKEIDQPILAVDGKTARRSHDRRNGLGALHSVSVWASEFGLSLGQVACDDKSNEITAIPELLRLVDLAGAIITIDAMGTQKAIAAQIVDAKADYVLALKGNQETLHDAVIEYIDAQVQNDFADVDVRQLTTTDRRHGRVEARSYFHMPVPDTLANLELWKGMKSIGAVVATCERDGRETSEIRYYISSLPVGVKQFARAVRGHWGIENGCHWCLDMIFREDESRIRDRTARENFAWLNRFLLSLLKQHPSKHSIISKRRLCGWDEDFMLQVLAGISS
jgi:predicted transposase YbfD/YdcC